MLNCSFLKDSGCVLDSRQEEHMNRKIYDNIIAVASGRKEADLCIRHAKILDVFNKEWFDGDLLISEGYIAGTVESGRGKARAYEEAGGRYLVPGFIDSHVHIESSHLSPTEFSNLVTPCGTTTVIADPHEIANVCGVNGIKYMLSSSEHAALSVMLMIPSCVPATSFEHSGANLDAKTIAPLLDKPRVLGLGEMMNYVGVVNGQKAVLDKVWEARSKDLIVDGHAPAISGKEMSAYVASGIRTSHESETPKELRERIRLGLYVMLRQGSACRNLNGLLGGVDGNNWRRCLFCTDDRQPKSILAEGHINNNVRMAVAGGLDPITAICIATINAAECYRLDDRGAIAPGRRADFLLFNDLKEFNPQRVFILGRQVAENGYLQVHSDAIEPKNVTGMMHVKDFSVRRLALHLKKDRVRVIDVIPGGVVTASGEATVKVEKGIWIHDPAADILKIAVIERHHDTGNIGLGLIRGYGLKHGAVAISIAHDSHNLIVVGDNDQDMAIAVEDLVRLGGGVALAKDGKVLGDLALPIAGLMTDQPAREVAGELAELHRIAFGTLKVNKDVDPLMTLCFMALPVIPALKITDMGLFDVNAFKRVPLEL